MNEITFLVILSTVVVVYLYFLRSILLAQNKVYVAFAIRSSVKKLLSNLNNFHGIVINKNIKLMFKEYFELILMKIDHSEIVNLLADLNKSSHADILLKSLALAALKDDGLFGLALYNNFHNPVNKSTIDDFLMSLPEEEKGNNTELP